MTVSRYRQKSADCVRMALYATTPEKRVAFEAEAKHWLSAAEREEAAAVERGLSEPKPA